MTYEMCEEKLQFISLAVRAREGLEISFFDLFFCISPEWGSCLLKACQKAREGARIRAKLFC